MEDRARALLAGIAFGGFVTTIVKVNILAVQALWRFNRLAAETAEDMCQGLYEKEREELQRRRRRQQEFI